MTSDSFIYLPSWRSTEFSDLSVSQSSCHSLVIMDLGWPCSPFLLNSLLFQVPCLCQWLHLCLRHISNPLIAPFSFLHSTADSTACPGAHQQTWSRGHCWAEQVRSRVGRSLLNGGIFNSNTGSLWDFKNILPSNPVASGEHSFYGSPWSTQDGNHSTFLTMWPSRGSTSCPLCCVLVLQLHTKTTFPIWGAPIVPQVMLCSCWDLQIISPRLQMWSRDLTICLFTWRSREPVDRTGRNRMSISSLLS